MLSTLKKAVILFGHGKPGAGEMVVIVFGHGKPGADDSKVCINCRKEVVRGSWRTTSNGQYKVIEHRKCPK